MSNKESKTYEHKHVAYEQNYELFSPHPGHVLIETDRDGMQKLYGVVMPQDQNDDTKIKGRIVSKTNSSDEKEEAINAHYSIRDIVFFKKWSGVEVYETSHFKYLAVSMKDLYGKFKKENHE